MYIKRDIESKLRQAADSFCAISLFGPRQVGKSTLLKNIFPNVQCVTLDDIELRDYAIRDPKGFIKYHSHPLIIDEIQKAPALLDYIKIEIDQAKEKALKENKKPELMYVLSGSNQYELQKSISESLAGRTAVFSLYSFSFNELRQRTVSSSFDPSIDVLLKKSRFLNEYRSRKEIFEDIFCGGMPEFAINKPDREMFFKSYVSTYIEKDIKRIIAADKESAFLNFMKYVSLRTGCQIDHAEISRNIGVDARTVKGWLSVLETSGIIKILQPYAKQVSNRIAKSGKLYFMDTGLCAYLAGIPSPEILERSAFAGAFFETYAISEILKSFSNGYKDAGCLYYYRDKDQYEVDLIVESFDSIYPIEIKKGINPVSHTKRFTTLNKYGKNVNVGLIIDSTDKVFPVNDSVYHCPIDIIGL